MEGPGSQVPSAAVHKLPNLTEKEENHFLFWSQNHKWFFSIFIGVWRLIEGCRGAPGLTEPSRESQRLPGKVKKPFLPRQQHDCPDSVAAIFWAIFWGHCFQFPWWVATCQFGNHCSRSGVSSILPAGRMHPPETIFLAPVVLACASVRNTTSSISWVNRHLRPNTLLAIHHASQQG